MSNFDYVGWDLVKQVAMEECDDGCYDTKEEFVDELMYFLFHQSYQNLEAMGITESEVSTYLSDYWERVHNGDKE